MRFRGTPAYYRLFGNHYWTFDTFISRGLVSSNVLQGTSFDPAAARFLARYRQWVYLPGPLSAGLLLVAAAATLGLGRTRLSGDRIALGLLTGSCVMPLLTGAALSGFSWRYQLPQIPLLPMAERSGSRRWCVVERPDNPSPTHRCGCWTGSPTS